jgi:hypothetical protein
MRAPDEFSDVASAGYREQAKRVAERGGARQDATSVDEEERRKQADEVRNLVLMALAALSTYGEATGVNRMKRWENKMDDPVKFFKDPAYKGEITVGPLPAQRPIRGSEAAAERSIEAQQALAGRLKWQPQEGFGQYRGGVGSLLGRHRPSGIGDPGLYRSSGGMSVPEDVLRAIEAVSKQAYSGIITSEELKVALWEIERRATPLGLSTRIGGTYRGGPPPGGILN